MSRQIAVCADAFEATRMTSGHTVVITDPPYTKFVQDRMFSVTSGGGAKRVDAGFDPLSDFGWVRDIVERTPRWSLFCCALESFGDYQRAAPERYIRSGIYAKTRALPQLSGDRPGQRCEGVAIFHGPEKKRWNGGGTHAFWYAMPENRKDTQHPTGKPTLLALRLVEQFTDPGDVVFDPFCGTGAFGRACAVLDRDYIGCDNNAGYIEIAKTRIEEARGQKRQWLARLEAAKAKMKDSGEAVREKSLQEAMGHDPIR